MRLAALDWHCSLASSAKSSRNSPQIVLYDAISADVCLVQNTAAEEEGLTVAPLLRILFDIPIHCMEVFVKLLGLSKILLASLFFAPATMAADTIASLKQEVRNLAWANIDKPENEQQVRQQLEGLVQRLQQIAPPVTEERIGQFSPGGWQQIWSDEQNMDPPGAPKRDLRQIYQVVNPAGWGFNFGLREFAPGQFITFALQVAASVKGDQQTTEITKAFSNSRRLENGEDLIQLAGAIYSGQSEFVERNAGRFPKGPIGAKGVLQIQFIDEDLKIGISPNVYNGKLELFVMDRTTVVRGNR